VGENIPRFSQSRLAAWLQVIVSNRREEAGLYREIAQKLPLEKTSRVLDVGTGTGLQLRAIHKLQPGAVLFGLDLSGAAIRAATRALSDLEVDLRTGNISSTDYPDDFFDLVTCNASMSYWKNPRDCFNEIYRILKLGGQALLFEPHQDIDLEAALEQIRENMADKGPLRRWGAVQLNKYGLKRGNRLGMVLYSIAELKELAFSSSFGENCSVDRTKLLKIPIFVCIQLWK